MTTTATVRSVFHQPQPKLKQLLAWPTPAQMTQSRRLGSVITVALPGGRHILIEEYLRSWKALIGMPPNRSVHGWDWFDVSVGDILSKISAGIHDRINRHLPWCDVLDRYNPDSHARSERRWKKLHDLVATGKLKCDCRWCGSALTSYHSHANRFCVGSCRRDYNS